ncbi:MAG: helix-turn-helix domain-containing protein [Polyangiaceae bacterium]
MTAAEITTLREALGLTQAQFATLLGVHSLTISKWERGVLEPTPYQVGLMQSFVRSQQQEPNVGAAIGGVLLAAGVGAALYLLLKPGVEAADAPRPKRRRRARA